MSALARWFVKGGVRVSGYDLTKTPLTDALEEEGMRVSFEDNPDSLPEEFRAFREDSLVVYTPAIPAGHKEFGYLKSVGYEPKKRSEVLGIITSGTFTVGVSGTHGKTTTSSMLAHLLDVGQKDCSAFLGGIATNFNSNLLLRGNVTDGLAVVEADEFDRSFLRLSPDQAVVTSVEPDHLDIYGEADSVFESFAEFIAKVPENGIVWASEKVPEFVLPENKNIEILRYGFGERADIRAENLRSTPDGYQVYDFVSPEARIENLKQLVPGRHNVENMLAAIHVALANGVDVGKIKEGVESFLGVKRRFEYVLKTENVTVIDDYAHHPTEVRAFLESVKEIYPGKELTVVFQPHLYTRTRDFFAGFAESLSLSDNLLLLDIYPARELPIEGVDSKLILDKVTCENKRLISKENALEFIRENKPGLLVTVGAGDVYQLLDPIKEIYR
ncbi:UDP-N-acetylmuramate--L-alanine ligase [Fulvitalea axinellae]|uniref:UDP-N-acetylmuramate--L-alanine ligase n=2 Tax=Fulvitalea axinellae TaxID=1182444 RepID=A0AAU9CKF8_9BACT|nr:UDP-N-acetylmuramate--L-alanine ligase [Fulvitalea axinellae]